MLHKRQGVTPPIKVLQGLKVLQQTKMLQKCPVHR